MWRMPYVIIRNILVLPGIIKKMQYLVKPEIYNEEKCYKYAHYIVDLMHRTGHIKTKGYGMENLPKEGGYMMYPNHQGKYDAYGIVGVHEKPCSVVMDEAKSRGPFITEVIDLLHGKRMSLKDTRQAMTVILEMSREVAEGRRYILFPEGGYVVGRKNGMGEFKAGCFKISLKTKTPIVPVVLWDSYKVYNSWEFRPVKTEVHFLKPIPYEEFKDMNTQEIAAMVQGKIQDKLDELKKEKVRMR